MLIRKSRVASSSEVRSHLTQLFQKLDLWSIDNNPFPYEPKKKIVKFWEIFADDRYHYSESTKPYSEYSKELDLERLNITNSFYHSYGFDFLLHMAKLIKMIHNLGYIAGRIKDIHKNLNFKSLFKNKELKEFSSSFIYSCFWNNGKWDFYEALNKEPWTLQENLSLLLILPCNPEAWRRVERDLVGKENLYWESVTGNPHFPENENDLRYLLNGYYSAGRIHPIIWLLSNENAMESKKIPFPTDIAYKTLIPSESFEYLGKGADTDRTHNQYSLQLVIQKLQDENKLSPLEYETLEWIYLPLFNSYGNALKLVPIHLEEKLISDPNFFLEGVQHTTLPVNYDPDKPIDLSFKSENISRFSSLISNLSNLPGLINGKFETDKFKEWINKILDLAEKRKYVDGVKKKLEKFLYVILLILMVCGSTEKLQKS